MQRPNFRHPSQGMGPRPGMFGSPTPAFDNRAGGMFTSPPWTFPNAPPPPFGPRFGQYCGSPNTPPREFGGNRGYGNSGSGGKGRFNNSFSPAHTPRRPNTNPRGTPSYKKSPYHSQSHGQHGGYQDSPRTSTPFGSSHGRERVENVEKFYKPSMLQDPWANLQPISVADKCSSPQAPNTDRKGRYFN
ncbi:M-phase-specific PLK1-interacting protein [Chanos chanos]|uniref:M-phase-specific PLK1-interacting protein n=1 Tax=Chanos chanos TaxID=29144 RepID=A0A6J2VEE8_CHACN|nr:M-phase-specific PLK1-interacting protein [Chanos chanos]